jgi:RNA polymerase sigma-70 factor (ECF subfamily)
MIEEKPAMSNSESTCWTMIDAAARGSTADREEFAKCYLPAIEAYLRSRWRNSSFRLLVDDAVQEVFVECFRTGGPLARADRERCGGFRPFLFGIVRNVALRFETHSRERLATRGSEESFDIGAVAADESTLSIQFDRAWARAMLRRAAQRQEQSARESGEAAMRRVELLRLRFQEGLPIRDIAKQWNEDPAKLHHEYAKARMEFKMALFEIMSFHHPGSSEEVEKECGLLLEILG